VTITYCETDPVSARWVGVNRLLTSFEVDFNFYQHDQRISTLETNAHTTVSIDNITLHGDELMFTMTDSTTRGPFTIPIATFRDRGAWAPSTPYSVNDVFTANGNLYLVIFAHTSSSGSFDPNANDGAGDNYYALLLSAPGSALPAGGATSQVLSKVDGTDYSVTWSYKLPTGGSTGQYLRKNSGTNQDAAWHAFEGVYAPPSSPGGVTGQMVATRDGSALNTEWVDGVYAPPASPAGQPGQSLATTTGSSVDMEWIDVVRAPPASPAGSAGQVLATTDGTAASTEWLTLALSALADVNVTKGVGIDGYSLTWNNTAGKWEATAPSSTTTSLSALTDVTVSEGSGIDGFLLSWNNTAGKWEAVAAFAPTLTSPSVGDTLTYDGTHWVNRPSFINIGSTSSNISLGTSGADYASGKFTPTGNLQILNGGAGREGEITTLIIITSGTSSFNITAGANVSMNGTLATGTVSGKKWTLAFVNDGTTLYEISRAGPM